MAKAAPDEVPFVSVIVPCRNEAGFIQDVIRSVVASAYPRHRLEAIFVDGMSSDGTRRILEEAALEHGFIRVLDNPLFTAPCAMNAGIRAARGEVIVRLDAHASYEPDYVPRTVRLLLSSPEIGSAGGRPIPQAWGEDPWARAVAFVTAHRFGVGNSAYRTSDRPGPVDTVALGAFRSAVLAQVGPYDERLTRNQDNELHARLQRAGYQVVFDPRITMLYWNQATLGGLLRQGLTTSIWNVYALVLHPYTWKWRRFAPLGFVLYLAALATAASLRAPWMSAAALPLALYGALLAAFSLRAGASNGGRLRLAATFVSYHLAYGVGPLIGLANIATGRWRAQLGRPLKR